MVEPSASASLTYSGLPGTSLPGHKVCAPCCCFVCRQAAAPPARKLQDCDAAGAVGALPALRLINNLAILVPAGFADKLAGQLGGEGRGCAGRHSAADYHRAYVAGAVTPSQARLP